MSQTAIEALRTAVHNAMIETVRMEDDSVQAWQNAVDTITERALSALTQGGVKGEPVGWRWTFDNVKWYHACEKPEEFRFGDPTAIEPTYAAPALSTTLQEPDSVADATIEFLVEHGMLDRSDEYSVDDVRGALIDNYEPTLQETVAKLWDDIEPNDPFQAAIEVNALISGEVRQNFWWEIKAKAMAAYFATLAHQPVTAGLEKAIDALEAIDAEYSITGQCKELIDDALAALKSEGCKTETDVMAGLDRLAKGGLRK